MADEILELGRARRRSRDEGMGLLPLLLLGGAGAAAYFLLRPRGPGQTVVAPIPPVAPPPAFPDLTAVDARFAEVRDLYRMGRLDPAQAWSQLEALRVAANQFGVPGTALSSQIAAFQEGVRQFAATGGTAPA